MKTQTFERKLFKNYEPMDIDTKFNTPEGETLEVMGLSDHAIIVGPNVTLIKADAPQLKTVDLEKMVSLAHVKSKPTFEDSEFERLIELYELRDSGTRLIGPNETEFLALWNKFKTYEISKQPKGKRTMPMTSMVCSACGSGSIKYYEISSIKKHKSIIDAKGNMKTIEFTEDSRPFTWRCLGCGRTNSITFRCDSVPVED